MRFYKVEGFPKLRDSFLGFPVTRTVIFVGPILGDSLCRETTKYLKGQPSIFVKSSLRMAFMISWGGTKA